MFLNRYVAVAGILSLGCWSAVSATSHGMWELTTTMQGAPSGDKKSSKTACISAAQVASGFEQALLDANAVATGKDQPALKCVLKGLKRDGAKSSWQSTCDGPRGAMSGVGAATFAATSAEINQAFEIKTPFGAMKLKQVIEAKRMGDCQ